MLQGGLFTRDWLIEGVKESEAWASLDDDRVAAARQAVGTALADLPRRRQPNEAETENKLVWPVLAALG